MPFAPARARSWLRAGIRRWGIRWRWLRGRLRWRWLRGRLRWRWLGRWRLRRRLGRRSGLGRGFRRGRGLRRSRWPAGVTAILSIAARGRRKRAIPLRCAQIPAWGEAAATAAARDAPVAAVAGTALGHRDQLRRGPSVHFLGDDFPDPYGLRKAAEAPSSPATYGGSEASDSEDHSRRRNDECYPPTRP